MAQRADGKEPDLESEVWSAIAAFEQILEAMPEDRSSLETLAHAYAHIGDQTRARDYFVRLGRVLLREGDRVALDELRESLQPYADDADVVALLTDMPAVTVQLSSDAAEASAVSADSAAVSAGAAASGDEASASAAEGGVDPIAPRKLQPRMLIFRVADELALAWALFEAAELTQAEYSSVAQDLSEMSGGRSDMTVSVLHVLENRAFNKLERVVAFIARHYQTPIIALHCFDLRPETFKLLPLEFIIRRGAIVFDVMQRDALVAVMNPSDKRLMADVAELTGRACHYFVTLASEFDAAVAGIRDAFG